MIKTELVVETVGSPNLQELSEIERRIFFETLYARIKELKEKQDNEQGEISHAKTS